MSSRTDCSGKSKSAHLHCMTQNSFHAENKTDCAAGREDFERSSAVASIPSQFYCFESCINGNGQGKLYDLVELKYIIEAKVVKNNENSDFNLSNETTKRDRLDLRRSMTPEATQSNKLMKRHSIEYKESKLEHVEHALPRKTVHFLPRSTACFFRNDELPLPNPQNFATNRNRLVLSCLIFDFDLFCIAGRLAQLISHRHGKFGVQSLAQEVLSRGDGPRHSFTLRRNTLEHIEGLFFFLVSH